jgi:hypothetical protein
MNKRENNMINLVMMRILKEHHKADLVVLVDSVDSVDLMLKISI